jgi:hypothetical protein
MITSIVIIQTKATIIINRLRALISRKKLFEVLLGIVFHILRSLITIMTSMPWRCNNSSQAYASALEVTSQQGCDDFHSSLHNIYSVQAAGTDIAKLAFECHRHDDTIPT